MGCDIHLHTEVKINDKWHHYGAPNVRRNYALFAKMAGVRNGNGIEPIAEPRGIPTDATELTQYDCAHWNGDGHSHSYLTAPEIAELSEWAQSDEQEFSFDRPSKVLFWESDTFGYLFGNDWSGFTKYPKDRPEGLEDVRFIFWFDN